MRLITDALNVVRHHWRAYVTINLVYYGLVIVGMVFVAFQPEVQQQMLSDIKKAFHGSGPLAAVGAAYLGGNVLKAIALTFLVNLLIGSFLTITVPSSIVPYSGLLMGVIRAIAWGLLLAPVDPTLRGPMIPHSLTLLIEGQAYILAMLAAYIAGNALLWPKAVGLETHGEGYLSGLTQTASLYMLVTVLLAVSAVYEALEVIYLAPLFR
jgi:hypothetical protein